MPTTSSCFRPAAVTASANSTVFFLPTKDGWVVVSPREEHQWLRWLEVMGSPAWGSDPRFATKQQRQGHWPEVHGLMSSWSRQEAKQAIFEAAQAQRVACYPLGTATDMLGNPHLAYYDWTEYTLKYAHLSGATWVVDGARSVLSPSAAAAAGVRRPR